MQECNALSKHIESWPNAGNTEKLDLFIIITVLLEKFKSTFLM